MTITLIMLLGFIKIPECFIDWCRIVTTLLNTENTVTFNHGSTRKIVNISSYYRSKYFSCKPTDVY